MGPQAGEQRHGTAVFRPRARLIHTIGDDLISDEIVAVIELVKNAYDADARNVLIEFTPPLTTGNGAITVADNGNGMSLTTVETAWMQLATPAKVRRRRSRGGRRVLGAKGIGRFAAARLASKLDLITRTTESSDEVCVHIDWEAFDRAEFLDEVEFDWELRLPSSITPGGAIERVWPPDTSLQSRPGKRSKNHGTILTLREVRKNWDAGALERLRTALSRLVSPFTESPDFEITLVLPEAFRAFAGPVEPPASLGHPDYVIRGHVDDHGHFQLVYEHAGSSQSIDGRHKLSRDDRKPVCGPFDIELRVWNRDTPSLESVAATINASGGSATIRSIQKDLDEASGISIYRDGFRVLPYGEKNNDWLRLDMRRVQNPTQRISNNQVVGAIQISADHNKGLEDQTNREGIKQGPAFQDMQTLTLAIIAEFEKKRFADRHADDGTLTSSPDDSQLVASRSLFADINLEPLHSLVQQRYSNDRVLQEAVDAQDRLIATRIDRVKEVLATYSRQATMGQLVDVILHDGRTYLSQLGNEVYLSRQEAATLKAQAPGAGQVETRLTRVQNYAGLLSELFRRIEPFSGRARGITENVAIETVIQDVIALLGSEIRDLGVVVEVPTGRTEIQAVRGEIQQIFVNLLQNSLYWLQQVPADARQIVCQVQRNAPDEVEVLFCDSGPGVSPQFRHLIFRPYFSGKIDGRGLGLTIAGETAAEYGGRLELVSSSLLPGACFRVILRQRAQ